MRGRIEILFKEAIQRHRVLYSLQRQLETAANVDRKRSGELKMITAADKHMIRETKK